MQSRFYVTNVMSKKQDKISQKIFFLSLLISLSSHSVELGNIHVFSKLREPLNAQVKIIPGKQENINQIKISLAEDNLYQKFGIEKNSIYDSLSLKLIKNQNGDDVISLVSSSLVTDGFFDILFNITYADKTMSREVQFYVDQGTNATAENLLPKNTISKKTFQILSSEDTIYKIAREHQMPGVSRAQMINAIFNLNRTAFDKEDINQIKIGSVLTLPPADYFKNLYAEAPLNNQKKIEEVLKFPTNQPKNENIANPEDSKTVNIYKKTKIPDPTKKNEALEKIAAFEEKINSLEAKLLQSNKLTEENPENNTTPVVSEKIKSDESVNNSLTDKLAFKIFQVSNTSRTIMTIYLIIILFLVLITIFLFIQIIQARKINLWKKNLNASYENNLRKTAKFSHQTPVRSPANQEIKSRPKNWRFY